MKKKVYYKLNRYKVAKVEVESVEQEQAVKILNRETDRFAKSEDTYYEKCSSLDEMYEETGFEPADDTPSPEEQMIRASEQNELKVRISYPVNKERLMDKTEVNMNVLNKVIAFKLLRILRDNGFIEDGKYANIERKSIQYGESIISQNKLVGR